MRRALLRKWDEDEFNHLLFMCNRNPALNQIKFHYSINLNEVREGIWIRFKKNALQWQWSKAFTYLKNTYQQKFILREARPTAWWSRGIRLSGSRVPIHVYSYFQWKDCSLEEWCNDAWFIFHSLRCTLQGSGRSLFSTRKVQSSASVLK